MVNAGCGLGPLRLTFFPFENAVLCKAAMNQKNTFGQKKAGPFFFFKVGHLPTLPLKGVSSVVWLSKIF